MIHWNRVTWYSQLLAIILALTIFFIGFYIGSIEVPTTPEEPPVTEEVATTWPTLQLPLAYFDYNNLESGSAGGEYPNWKSGRFSNGYRSFPTTTILFDDYSNELVDLPPLPTLAEWELITSDDTLYSSYYKEQGEEFGDIGKIFSNEGMEISRAEVVDVTGDFEPEIIVALGGMGANHHPHYYKIIQGDKIIFESGDKTQQLAGIVPHGTGNGFTISWRDSKHLTQGLCCALGNYSTRFVYKDGVFTPLYEQEELYYHVENSEFTEGQ